MNIDERLRRALRDEVDDLEPMPDSWSRVETGVRRTRRRRRVGGAVAVAAALVAAVIVVPSLLDRDDARVQTTPAHEGASTTTTVVTAPNEGDTSDAIWPFTSRDQVTAYVANPGAGMFFDPEATALELARAYLGMPDPVRDGAVDRPADDRAVVRVRPKSASHAVTVVSLQRFGGAHGPWSVTGATTENIELDVPSGGAPVTSPVHVAGRSIAFEAVVHVEVRGDGQTFGQSLAATTVMGGGTEVAPFRGDVAFTTPATTGGAIVLYTDSAEDGSIVEATVVRVRFSR